jgi:integrase
MLFDWLITRQVLPTNPAAAVRGPKHVVKTGSTPVFEGAEWRKLLGSIPTATLRDLRDRALIATYSFARIGAALKMKVEDLRPRGAGWMVRLHEKGGKQHAMPCHHALAEALRAYINDCSQWPPSSPSGPSKTRIDLHRVQLRIPRHPACRLVGFQQALSIRSSTRCHCNCNRATISPNYLPRQACTRMGPSQ